MSILGARTGGTRGGSGGIESETSSRPAVNRSVDELVRRARDGDGVAFDRLYERHVGRVYATCLRLTADRREAEELTQDVFVRVWRNLESFRGRSRFSTWLYRVAVNVVLDARRKRKRMHDRTTELKEVDLPVPGDREPVNRMALERAIARLPERARTAIVLYAIEGYRYAEVAELMDIAVGTVKAHIHRARTRLLEEVGR